MSRLTAATPVYDRRFLRRRSIVLLPRPEHEPAHGAAKPEQVAEDNLTLREASACRRLRSAVEPQHLAGRWNLDVP